MIAIKFYGIDAQGKIHIQRLSTLPAWAGTDEGRLLYAEDVDKFYYGDDAEWVEIIGDVSSLDGDHLDIDWDPTYYNPDAGIAEAADVDDLSAHLKGIDTVLGSLGASAATAAYDYILFDEQLVDPSTDANQMAFFAKEATTGSNTMPYFRQESNGNTIRILIGDASAKFWMYRNSTSPGFVIDATVTDRVLAFKGGTDAYNVNGGNQAGTWTQPSHIHSGPSHTHTTDAHTHTGGAHTHAVTYSGGATYGAVVAYSVTFTIASGEAAATGSGAGGSTSAGGTGSTGSGATAATYRPYAAVGTLQYPDI